MYNSLNGKKIPPLSPILLNECVTSFMDGAAPIHVSTTNYLNNKSCHFFLKSDYMCCVYYFVVVVVAVAFLFWKEENGAT